MPDRHRTVRNKEKPRQGWGPERGRWGISFMTGRNVSDDRGAENTPDMRNQVRADHPFMLPDLPALIRLKQDRKWVAWEHKKRRSGKPLKKPINPQTGQGASVSNPKHWGSYDQAAARAARDNLAGLGYVLTNNDGITGIDIDGVRDKETGELEPWVADLVASAETYVEVSPSGTGLRILCLGKIKGSVINTATSVEMYVSGRYLTITGDHLVSTPTDILPAPHTIAALLSRVAKSKSTSGQELVSLREAFSSKRPSRWRQVNTAALANLDTWVPALFGETVARNSSGVYRISSIDLGRDLEEDLSISPMGIKDFGLHDQGDPKEGKRSPTDLVMERTGKDFNDAVNWLRERLGLPDPDPRVGGVTFDDFLAYLPAHTYCFLPTREFWPAASINSQFGKVDASGRPHPDGINANVWLDQNQSIEQMVWSPAHPLLIEDRLVAEGGWIERSGVTTLNIYLPPTIVAGDAAKAGPWLDHIRRIFPEEADHLFKWLAHRVQRPGEKINHGIVLGGAQGVGKDTLLEPVKRAVGPWNFIEVSPQQMSGRFNSFAKSVILRVSEARDLGSDKDRFGFYEHMKVYMAAPPDVLRVDEKNLREYSVFNCCGVIITTNRKDSIHLPADDRRHYVCWSDLSKDDFSAKNWNELYHWYEEEDGYSHVAAYLRTLDLTEFDPKAPPPKTAVFWQIVETNRSPEESELADVLNRLNKPDAVTIAQIEKEAWNAGTMYDFHEWISNRKNRRAIPHRMEECGYVSIRQDTRKDGYWLVGGTPQVIYAKAELPVRDRFAAAAALVRAATPGGLGLDH